MSTTVTNKLKLTMTYIDSTERTYSLPQLTRPTASDVKAAVLNFNANASITGGDIQKTFISENGMQLIGITDAVIETVTEEVIYSG